MKLSIPPSVKDFLETFHHHQKEIYIVGGAVRNLLLDRPITNWDFTTNAKPEEILEYFPESFYHNAYGTVTIPNKLETGTLLFEVTPYRKESDYRDMRHPETLSWADTLEEDLSRRDFTINAMAYDGKTLVDPFEGRKHVKQGIIQTVGEARMRFSEDALRLLRAVRLASELGFLIEETTREAITSQAEHITRISWERIRDEFLKILTSDHPAEGVLFLRNTGLLKYILPELDICFSIPQKSPKRHHIYDAGTHQVMALKHCPSADAITRFATLIHDVGKAQTYRQDAETGLITFYNHEVVGEKHAREIADRFRLSNEQKEQLVTLVAHHQFTVSELQTDKAIRRFIRKVGTKYVQDMIDLRIGDRIGSGARPTSWRLEKFKERIIAVQQQPFSVTDLKIDGHDIMALFSLKPSRQVGELLQRIFSAVEEGLVPNEKEALATYAQSIREETTKDISR